MISFWPIFSISKKFLSFSFEIPNKSKNTYKTNEKSTCFKMTFFWRKFQKHKSNDVIIMIGKFIRITRALLLFHERNTENEPKWKSQDKRDHLQNRKVFKNTRVFIEFEIRKETLIELSSKSLSKWEFLFKKKTLKKHFFKDWWKCKVFAPALA